MTIRDATFFGLLAFAAFVAAIGLLPPGREFVAVDRCLDRGGSFDYTRSTCDFENDHGYRPYLARHPVRVPVILSASVMIAAAALAVRRVLSRPEAA